MRKLLEHFFLPNITNNYRPRLLHNKILTLFILFFFSAGIIMSVVKTNFPSVLGISSNVSTQDLLILTNQQRENNNLAPLTDNPELDIAAENKAKDMFARNYWAHIAPDGTTPWVFVRNAGYNYIYAGENLARGYNSAQDVISAWMASPEHRANVLSSHYQNVGFAVETGNLTGEDTVLVVEMLGSTSLAQVPSENSKSLTTQVITSESPTPAIAKVNTITPSQNNTINQKSQIVAAASSSKGKTIVNSATFSSLSAKTIVSLFIFILILDMIIIERKKIVRFVGHNLDHVIFLSLILIIILIIFKGWIA